MTARGSGGGGGAGGPAGPPPSSGVGGRHPQAPETSGPEVARILWPLGQHSSGPCRSPDKVALPTLLALLLHTEPYSARAGPLCAPPSSHMLFPQWLQTASFLPKPDSGARPRPCFPGPQAEMAAPSRVPSLSDISEVILYVSVPPPRGLFHAGQARRLQVPV